MQAPVPPFRPPELDAAQALTTLRRNAASIALFAALCSAGTYAYEQRQPPTYDSVSSVLAAQDASQNTLINNTLVTAPPLPIGAVDQALHSQGVVDDIIRELNRSGLNERATARVNAELNLELRTQHFQRVTVKEKLDAFQRGVYELHASGLNPEEAQGLANAAVTAVLHWDQARAQSGVERAKRSLKTQYADLSARVRSATSGSPEQSALISSLGQVSQNLAQVSVFEQAAVGPLTLIASANRPLTPVRPNPRRNALIALITALLAGSAAALGFDALRRRVTTEADLQDLRTPLLGTLPRLTAQELKGGYLKGAASSVMYEQIGFLRLPLQELRPPGQQRRIVVSSARPGEGKSCVAASLARSFALTGQTVLLIDADLHRPTQTKLWNLTAPTQVRTVNGSDQHAPIATVERSASDAGRIDLIPAGPARAGASVLNRPGWAATLDALSAGYDTVIIDTPPLLSVADALNVGRLSDGLLLVIEAGKTRRAEIDRTVQLIERSQTRLLGLVLNKTTRAQGGYAGYAYSYARPALPDATQPDATRNERPFTPGT